MKCTIIICTHNRCSMLKKTLDGVISQVFGKDDCDIVVIDNASSDDTGVLLAEYVSKYGFLSTAYEPKKGKQWALNRGIAISTGDLLIFTDDDILFADDWLASIQSAVEAYPHCRVFGGKIIPYFEDGSIVPDWVCHEHPNNTAEGPLGEHDYGDVVKSYYEFGLSTPFGANMFMHRSVFDDYGLVDPDLFGDERALPNEDSILGSSIKNKSEEMLYIPGAVVYHVVDSARLDKSFFRKFYAGSAKTCVLGSDRDGVGPKFRIFNVPRWFYIKLGKAMLQYIVSCARFDRKDIVFARELGVIFYLNVIVGFWRLRRTGRP